jgi:hypothetical protein
LNLVFRVVLLDAEGRRVHVGPLRWVGRVNRSVASLVAEGRVLEILVRVSSPRGKSGASMQITFSVRPPLPPLLG